MKTNLNRVVYTVLMVFAVFTQVSGQSKPAYITGQKYRPLYHFSPEKGWIGDPDGLVIHKGLYHLYWWGHATSPDLVHWTEQPKPMKGDDGTFSYFSGSVAVDRDNTSGFGKNSMLAVYTRHYPGDTLPETQALSVSTDDGLTFNYYKNNPVLDIGKIFFRDPQVFWYAPDKLWKMVVSLPNIQQIHIYESKDLKSWTYCSAFGGLGAKNSFWECPDLFQLPVAGTTQKKWVMLIGRGPNRVQYFTGDFDGKVFTPDSRAADHLKTGKGLDGVVFEDFEQGLSNWKAADAAFTINPATDVVDYLGNNYAASSNSTGKIISRPFKIKHSAINFLLAGDKHPDTTCIRLIIDGKVYRSATGDNSKVFKWNGWDVHELVGKQAHIEIINNYAPTGNASIAIDHILLSDKLLNQQLEHAQWLDYGPDYYATRTWRNYDDNKVIGDSVFAIGWMGNWDYANKVPTQWGKGFQSIPRVMTLKQDKQHGYTLVQNPVPQLQQLRGKVFKTGNVKVQGIQTVDFAPEKNSYEIDMLFKPGKAAVFGLNLLEGEGRKLALRYNPVTSILTLDRSNCTDHLTDTVFTRLFAKKVTAPVNLLNGMLRLHIFVDQSSIEIFVNDGETVLSATTFPSQKQLGITMHSEGGTTQLAGFSAWELNTIWK